MIRRIIQIDEEKCNGCGACASACHEGAIGMVDGKARLLRDDYCDGLGDCLPACPTGAITFTEREAAAYDESAVLENKLKKQGHGHSGCPGHQLRQLRQAQDDAVGDKNVPSCESGRPSRLAQWPCQIKLIPVNAPCFDGAKLLIAADCTAYAYANLHEEFMRGKVTLIGCPKLDGVKEKDGTFSLDNDKAPRFWFFSTKAAGRYDEARFAPGDFLVFGKETKGLPEDLLRANFKNTLRIPMRAEARSLNLSNSVAVAVYEALRQNSFGTLKGTGMLAGHATQE